MVNIEPDIIATKVTIGDSTVHLELEDGSTHSFPIFYYPQLVHAKPEQLSKVKLRVGGRALRWEELDEDIWITDAICQNYPKSRFAGVAESPKTYGAKPSE